MYTKNQLRSHEFSWLCVLLHARVSFHHVRGYGWNHMHFRDCVCVCRHVLHPVRGRGFQEDHSLPGQVHTRMHDARAVIVLVIAYMCKCHLFEDQKSEPEALLSGAGWWEWGPYVYMYKYIYIYIYIYICIRCTGEWVHLCIYAMCWGLQLIMTRITDENHCLPGQVGKNVDRRYAFMVLVIA